MMPIFPCNLCPFTFVTQSELASHMYKHQHHITSASASTSYQANQGSTIAGSGSGAGFNPSQIPERSLQIDPFKVFNSSLMTGNEVLIAANTIYWMSRDRRCIFDYSQPLHLKLEASDYPPSAKRHRGDSKSVPLVLAETRRRVYRCDECPMEFPSYHALGGHKSGHRKAEARSRAAAAQLNQVPPQPQPQLQPQPQPQEAPPPAPPSQFKRKPARKAKFTRLRDLSPWARV